MSDRLTEILFNNAEADRRELERLRAEHAEMAALLGPVRDSLWRIVIEIERGDGSITMLGIAQRLRRAADSIDAARIQEEAP